MSAHQLRIAIVGSGPSGTYTALALCEAIEDIRVDVYEQLPVPFGLVRYGVAPDHQKIKSVIGSLNEVYTDPRVRFHGNVQIGRDVSLTELREAYSAVVVASGAAADRRLDIPNENVEGVWSATDFVAWYSGHPDAAVDRFTLDAERVAIVGVGNVALDVARILCRTPDEMRATDVPEHVVDVLAKSSVRHVLLLGRRSMAHAKFSARELDELHSLTDTDLLVNPRAVPADTSELAPAARRMVATLAGFTGTIRPDARRTIRFEFDQRPVQIVGDPIHTLEIADQAGRAERARVDLLIRSVGYRAEPFPGLPFDPTTHTVPHDAGRVIGEDGQPADGMYVVGWIKRGPSGIIGTNRVDASETVRTLLGDLSSNPRKSRDLGHHPSSVVDWEGWRRIDETEKRRGADLGRGRVKIHERASLLGAAKPDQAEAKPE